MGNFGLLFAMNDNRGELKIRKYPGDEFGDAPDEHRWRAWWDNDGIDGAVRGIVLRCYPVTKITPRGAWIDPNAWTQHGRDGVAWNKRHEFARWVSNYGRAAWAKRTQKEALVSIAVRHARWSQRIIGDARYFIEATRALRLLMPERAERADQAIRELANFVATECSNDNDSSALDQKGLKPCPFCGGNLWVGAVRTPDDNGDLEVSGYRPWCKTCKASLEVSPTEAEAIAAWNRRSTVTPAEIAGVVEELRKRKPFGGPSSNPLDIKAATLIERLAASQAEMER